MNNKSCIIYCRCGAGITSDKGSGSMAETLATAGTDIYEIQDLCAVSLNEKELLGSIGNEYSRKIIIACYPRAIKSLLRQNMIDLGNYEVINLREESPESAVAKVMSLLKEPSEESNYRRIESRLKVPAWYPVVDITRCTLCGQCAGFCLFGVYQLNKERLRVVNPLACKNGCPACGRTCPSSAIIFPKVPENSVLSGANPDSITESTKKSGDEERLIDSLKERNKNRKTIFRQDLVRQAEEERRKALDKINDSEGRES
jgi:NAD-dependent dihydropyrimidine dehydrogenase PreA subunit